MASNDTPGIDGAARDASDRSTGTPAQFFDGHTAQRHKVHITLSVDRHALCVTGDSLPQPLRWRLMDLRALGDASDRTRLTLTRHAESTDESPRDVARLVISDPDLVDWLHRTRPDLFRTDLHKGTGRKVLTYTAGAIAACALMLFVILPAMADTMARIIPVEREAAFGKTVTANMERVLGASRVGDLRCRNPEGEAALQAMLTRLTLNRDMAYEVQLQVFDHPMVNAFAAPGGQVVLLRGLLEEASHPDEVAGVLAHEIAHVEHRDATRQALRAAGSAGILTMIVGDFTGGAAVAVIGEHMISASYTREAEAAADLFALDMLDTAGVSARGFATFFDTIDDLKGFELPQYLATHPVTKERAEQARGFADTQGGTAPILSDGEWRALQNICV